MQSTCSAAQLGKEFEATLRAMNDADERYLAASGQEGDKLWRRQMLLSERLEDIRRYASGVQPESPLGALFLLNLISGFISRAKECGDLPKDLVDEADCADRMAYGIRAFIEGTTGTDAEQVGADYCMPRSLDSLALTRISQAH